MNILDTSVAVDHLRGHQPAMVLLREILTANDPLVGCELVRFELLAGARPRDLDRVERFCDAVEWFPVTEAISRQAGDFARRFRGSHSGIDAVDYCIAATAVVLGGRLLTMNVRHFSMFEGLASPY